IDDSSPIVNNFEQMARDLFEYRAGDSFRKLRAIEWNDVGASVYAELWSRAATARAEWFGTLTIDQLPSGKRAYEDMGKALKGKMDISPSEERIAHAAQMMTVGVGAALLRAGWRFETSPGSPLAATNGAARISPREVVERLVENADAYKEWRKACDALGITGLPLRPSPDATAAVTT
ncbi:MAG TPA: hypothetical protein VMS40_17895, partial [Vicinamibacterales bacterium]|nr:hypothetical protein [Vicinamibacterales bacterium]